MRRRMNNYPESRTELLIDIIQQSERVVPSAELARMLSEREGGTKVTSQIVQVYLKRHLEKHGGHAKIKIKKVPRPPHVCGPPVLGYYSSDLKK